MAKPRIRAYNKCTGISSTCGCAIRLCAEYWKIAIIMAVMDNKRKIRIVILWSLGIEPYHFMWKRQRAPISIRDLPPSQIGMKIGAKMGRFPGHSR
jgi:hypothetical protein